METSKNSQVTIQRSPHDKKNPYVMINREIFHDKSISPKAKGLLGYLLTLPPDWIIYHSQLQEALNVGEEYVNSAMDELLKNGYAERTREKFKGVFQPYQYTIYEFKKCLPNGENRPGFSGPENPVILSKEKEKKETHIHNSSISTNISMESRRSESTAAVSAAVKSQVLNSNEKMISVKNSKGQTLSISEDEIHKHLVRCSFPSSAIEKSIEVLKKTQEPVNNILKFLESICLRIDKNKKSSVKSEPSKTQDCPVDVKNYEPGITLAEARRRLEEKQKRNNQTNEART